MTTPAGWYPDPSDSSVLRWFDGTAWTEHSRPAEPGAQSAPPPSPAPETGPPAFRLGAREVLGTPEQPARGGRLGKGLAVGAAGVAVLAIAGGAYAFSTLSGGGAQPETALPASAIGYAELDLDPPAGQKLAVYRLAKKFPKSGVRGEGSLRDDLLSKAFGEDLPEGTSYEADIKPWVGDRAGVAVLDRLDEDQQPQVAAAVQYTDRGAAEKHLKKLAAAHGDLGYAFGADGYVVLAKTSALAQQVVADAKASPLSESTRYADAVDALGGDQIGVAWLDVKGVYDVLPEDAKTSFADSPLFQEGQTPSGQVVVGVSAASDHVDLRGRVLGVQTGTAPTGLAAGRAGTGKVLQSMPADAFAAASVTDAGKGLSQLYTRVTRATSGAAPEGGLGSDLFDLPSTLEQYGLDLPADIEKVFGTELAVAGVGDGPDVVARVEGGDPARALQIIRKVDESGESTDLVAKDGEDLVVGSTPEALAKVRGDGGLGRSALFREALPEVDGAGLAAFVDVQRTIAAFGDDGSLTDEDRADLAPLAAVGLTTQGGADGRFLLRVTVR